MLNVDFFESKKFAFSDSQLGYLGYSRRGLFMHRVDTESVLAPMLSGSADVAALATAPLAAWHEFVEPLALMTMKSMPLVVNGEPESVEETMNGNKP